MKTLNLIAITLALNVSLVPRAHPIECLAGPFLEVADVRQQLVETLTEHLKARTPSIQTSPRFAEYVNAADKVIACDALTKRSLAGAEKRATELGVTALGADTAGTFEGILTSDRVISSTADLDNAGRAVGELMAKKGDSYADELLMLRKSTIDFLTGPPNNVIFSEAEMLNDLKVVFDTIPPAELDKLVDPLHGVNNWGPLGEVHGVGVLKRERNVTVTAIEPSYSGVGTRKPVDFVCSDGLLLQHKVTTDLLETALGDQFIAKDIIAVEAQAGAGTFRFSFNQGDPATLTHAIDDLNAALASQGSARVFTLNDFIKLPWDK